MPEDKEIDKIKRQLGAAEEKIRTIEKEHGRILAGLVVAALLLGLMTALYFDHRKETIDRISQEEKEYGSVGPLVEILDNGRHCYPAEGPAKRAHAEVFYLNTILNGINDRAREADNLRETIERHIFSPDLSYRDIQNDIKNQYAGFIPPEWGPPPPPFSLPDVTDITQLGVGDGSEYCFYVEWPDHRKPEWASPSGEKPGS